MTTVRNQWRVEEWERKRRTGSASLEVGQVALEPRHVDDIKMVSGFVE
jgi:hypothetical protein